MSVRAQKIQSEASCLRSKLRCFSSFTKKNVEIKKLFKKLLGHRFWIYFGNKDINKFSRRNAFIVVVTPMHRYLHSQEVEFSLCNVALLNVLSRCQWCILIYFYRKKNCRSISFKHTRIVYIKKYIRIRRRNRD